MSDRTGSPVVAEEEQIASDPAGRAGPTATLFEDLFAEIMRGSHRYAPGVEQRRPTLVDSHEAIGRRTARRVREHCRNAVERLASRAGFTRRHFDPGVAGRQLATILDQSDGLRHTYSLLGDERSRSAFASLLELRVLGPHHAPLRLTPGAYRSMQRYVNRKLRLERDTFDVSDPWFSPLSLYRVDVDGGVPVTLHSHSVDVVSVFLCNQYSYCGERRVGVQPGDVVIDVGGCWGDTALYFASLVGPRGKVFTFEFDPESLAVMRENLSLNPQLAERIEVIEEALWDRSGEALEFQAAGRMTAISDDAGQTPASGTAVQTITLDDFVQRAGLQTIDFLKMDVEGAELNVLRGARGSLARFAPRLAIAAYHYDDDLIRIPQAIDPQSHGYVLYLDSFSPVQEETVLFAVASDSG